MASSGLVSGILEECRVRRSSFFSWMVEWSFRCVVFSQSARDFKCSGSNEETRKTREE